MGLRLKKSRYERKEQMKKAIIIFFITVVLASCGPVAEVEKKNVMDETVTSRFVEIERTIDWEIVADRKTGVMYSVSMGGYNRGNFTLLVNEEGEPLIWDGMKGDD